MSFLLHRVTGRVSLLTVLCAGVLINVTAFAQAPPGGTAASQIELAAMTSEWKGDRYPDGRPRVADNLLRRMKAISIEEAWDVLRPARL